MMTLSWFATSAADLLEPLRALEPAARERFMTPAAWLVLGGAFVSTFVASVMAEEQDKRLRNGTFGALAGSAVGALAELISKEQHLLLVGFCGSALGALLGWFVSLALAWYASGGGRGKVVLTYLTGGFGAVRDSLAIEGRDALIVALREWGTDYARRANRQREAILALPRNAETNKVIELALRGWMDSMTDMLRLLFKLAKTPDRSSRVTVIVFGTKSGVVQGLHWIHGSGGSKEHNLTKPFDQKSIGYKVLQGALPSPYFLDAMDAKTLGQDREQGNKNRLPYRPFLTFRLNEVVIVAIDWPNEMKADDRQYVDFVRQLFQDDVCRAIEELLKHWSGPLVAAVGLDPLPTPAPPPEPLAAVATPA